MVSCHCKYLLANSCCFTVAQDAVKLDMPLHNIWPLHTSKYCWHALNMQVYKDFAKGGKVVTGIFTRDYRSDVENSRVLITVPECFEILLFTPGHQQLGQENTLRHF